MPQFRTIEIDFDVHRRVENERRGFDESPNDALRRLLNLGEPKPTVPPSDTDNREGHRGWTDGEVELPHGTALRMSYSRRTYEGLILDGEWVIDKKKFKSPSGAASGVALTKKGKSTPLNGWKYWEIRFPRQDKWILLRDLLPKVPRSDNLNLEELEL